MFKLPLVQLLIIVAFIVAPLGDTPTNFTASDITKMKLASAVSCTPDREWLSRITDEHEIFLLPGSGSYVWKIDTKSDSAQLYFNQGVNTYYGFHIIESIASFKKAATFDPDNPMVWWAQALAYGPNINDFGYSASPDALEAVGKSIALLDKATPLEASLIKAMQVRYSADTTQTREVLNQKYADAMKKVYEEHPQSADAAALYADAMMLQHPWYLWEVNGTPKPWTPLIREVLEKGFTLHDRHPGLHHYYIHVIEPSPEPSRALASADILGTITPGLAHLVHMPSHIYLRTGEYTKGAAINKDALSQFQQYVTMYPPAVGGGFIYDLHNRHMLANCAMLAGDYQTSITAAKELQQAIDSATLFTAPPVGSIVQYIYMTPVIINVRFEKWDDLLQMNKPDNALVYANLLYEFGRGMANAGKGNIAEARNNADRVDALMKDEVLKLDAKPFSPAIEGAKTARELLVGYIYLKEKKFKKAIHHLTTAAETERQMVYNEPRDWFLNPYQYVGEAYMAARKYKEAEAAYNMDLAANAKNVWSLKGVEKARRR
jgi:hypothetical protein